MGREGHFASSCPGNFRSLPLGDAETPLIYSLLWAEIQAYNECMQILPISKVKDRLNELVDAASVTHEQVTITKNGSPAAVLVGVDEWESLQESLFWLSQPGTLDTIAAGRADIAGGGGLSEEQIRAEFGVPKRAQ